MRFCLIGKKLGHSYSGIIHRACGLDYDLVELTPDELEAFVRSGRYDGFNVTIPYKKHIMAYLDEVDEVAREVGAVNTVARVDGKLVGYNTDVLGLGEMIESTGVSLAGKHVVVLGSGGASATVQAVAKAMGASKVTVVSRTGEVNYQNVYDLCRDAQVVINATPVGMFPDVEDSPVDVTKFDCLEAVFDCVYNPIRTSLVLDALKQGVVAKGGLDMLVGQAFGAQKIWGVFNAELAENTAKSLASQQNNLVLSGMAGCGKSTIGRAIADALGRPFVDTDEEIFACTGRTCEEIIVADGEKAFRAIESSVVARVAKGSGQVISLGGGAVLDEKNVCALKRNGVIVYVERQVDCLDSTGRPLSQAEGAGALFARRKPVYEGTCDIKVVNDGTVDDAVKEVIGLYERISHQRS